MKERTKALIAVATASSLIATGLLLINPEDGMPYDDLFCNTLYISDEYNNTIYCSKIIIGETPDPYPLLLSNLSVGWNLFSTTLTEAVDKLDLHIFFNEEFLPWYQAVQQNLVINWIYCFNSSLNFYEFVDLIVGSKGYFIYSYVNCSLWILEEP